MTLLSRCHRTRTIVRAVALSTILFGVTLSTVIAEPSDAWADDESGHYDRGVEFFKDGDYTAAMVEFKQAYQQDPNYRVLYNLGQTSRELNDYAFSLSSFERYLSEGGDKIDPARRKQVETSITELKGKVGSISLKVAVEGAEVTIDDVSVGNTPLPKPLVVNAGKHKVSVSKSGYAPLTRFVEVPATETTDLPLELVSLTSEGGGGGEGPGPVGPAPYESPVEPGQWVMLAITGAVGISAAVVGGVALGKKANFETALTTAPTTPDAIETARSSAQTFATTADVLMGITVAAGVTTTILFIVDLTSAPDEEAPAEDAAKPTVSLQAGPSFVGVQGTF